MDLMDRASEAERLELEYTLRMITQRKREGGPVWIYGMACCRACGDEIPKRRLEAIEGCSRCVACQERYDRGED
ncbi:MAG: TraR/DksA C4-type zinc finger protein [Desulfovibrionales bacterium]